jgi:hypothetical protein
MPVIPRSQGSTSQLGQEEIADRHSASYKARELLCEILPAAAREELLAHDAFYYQGKRAIYRICRSSQTEIYWNGRLSAHACLQLTIPAPSYDRMIAEYLILNSDEKLYWTKANILRARREIFSLPILLLGGLNLVLLIKLIVEYLL